MRITIIALTTGGYKLAEKICSLQEDTVIDSRPISVSQKMASLWKEGVGGIVCIMAAGIVVRGIAPLCQDKRKDPCVLVLDEKGEFVISLLSGHAGGGNQIALELAGKLNAQAVITTASDVTGHTALDLWARKNNLLVHDTAKLTAMSAKLVNENSLRVFVDCGVESLPHDFESVPTWRDADIIVSDSLFNESDALILRPCALTVGLGCNRGTVAIDFETSVSELFTQYQLSRKAISGYASIDLKSDEAGMLEFVNHEQIPIQFYTKDSLNSVAGVSSSAIVYKATGAKGVAEPAAILAAQTKVGSGELIVRKQKWKDVTVAVAVKKIRLVA